MPKSDIQFPEIKHELKVMVRTVREPIYALDDQCALKINGKKIEVVGGGKYLVFNA